MGGDEDVGQKIHGWVWGLTNPKPNPDPEPDPEPDPTPDERVGVEPSS